MAGPKSKDKSMIHLIPKEAIDGMAKGFMFGIEKHGKHQFRDNNITWTEVGDALLRHTLAFLSGEDNDPETGYPHTWHIGANYAMLEFKRANRKHLDDRYREKDIIEKEVEKLSNEITVYKPKKKRKKKNAAKSKKTRS